MKDYCNGFIVIQRKIRKWEWFTDANTCLVFFHLLLSANWEEGRFLGHVVPSGSLITSFSKLAEECGLSVRNVRTALKHLESTGEITRKVTNKWQAISLVKWAEYQDADYIPTRKVTNNRQATDKQVTTNKQSNKATNNKKETDKEKILVPDDMPKALKEALNEWLAYKKERKQKYTETGWKKLMTQIRNASEKYGTESVIESINNSMANNYQGIFFDRVNKRSGKSINFDYEQRKIKNEDFEHLFLDLDKDPTEGI